MVPTNTREVPSIRRITSGISRNSYTERLPIAKSLEWSGTRDINNELQLDIIDKRKRSLTSTLLGAYRWGMGGRMNDFEVDIFKNEEPAYYSSHLKQTTYPDLRKHIIDVRDGLATESELMAFVNSDAVVGKLKTVESYIEFLASELGYVHLNPGVYPKQYIVAERISHYDSGFFGLILKPHNVVNSDNYRHILIIRGTTIKQSHQMMERKASTGFPLNLDYRGIALTFSEWPIFREMLVKVFTKYKLSDFVFCGHSLGAILSLRIMDYFKKAFPYIFENSLVYMFNSPVISSSSIPNVSNVPKQVINVHTDNDLVQNAPFFTKEPEGFVKLMRVNEKLHIFAVISNALVIHKIAPLTKSSIEGEDLRFHITHK